MSEQDGVLLPAATTVLLREQGGNLEVLMVERHSDIAFAGGAMVFPGGRVADGDYDVAWRDLADGLSDEPALAVGMVAAVREAFEETGLLLARRGDDVVGEDVVNALNGERSVVEADDRHFLEIMRREKLRLACDQLTLFAHWRAPKRVPKRFDTLFFAARAPHEQIAKPDGREAVATLWARPETLINDAENGDRRIIFPTRRNLEIINLHDNAQAVLEGAKDRPIEPVEPWVETRGDQAFLVIPDHLGYPVTEENIRTAMRG